MPPYTIERDGRWLSATAWRWAHYPSQTFGHARTRAGAVRALAPSIARG